MNRISTELLSSELTHIHTCRKTKHTSALGNNKPETDWVTNIPYLM